MSTTRPTPSVEIRPDFTRRPQTGLPDVRRTCLLAASLLALLGCNGKATTNDSREANPKGALAAETMKASAAQSKAADRGTDKPVIWCFVGSRDKASSVVSALRSGRISHVAIFSGNRITSDTLHKPETKAAIETVKQAEDVRLILVRYLWQTQPGPHSRLETLTDAEYYVSEINKLRQEAAEIGATLVGLDTETYGPTELTAHFRGRRFTEEHFDKISAAVAAATGRAGKVDFVLPAGSARAWHPYLALAGLGDQRIAEATYYDNPQRIAGVDYPYEIAGMYMNVVKSNEGHPHLPYFLPSEVFGEKSHVWQRKEGLMIWPREERSLEVANALVEATK